MFCLECGAKVREDTDFCPNCGKKLRESKEETSEKLPPQTKKSSSKTTFIIILVILLIGGVVGGGFYYLKREKTDIGLIGEKGEKSLISLTPSPTSTMTPQPLPSSTPSPKPTEVSLPSGTPTPTMILKVYFANSGKSGGIDCSKVFPVERSVSKTLGVARASLNELFKGPTTEEKSQGYTSFFSEKTKAILKNIKIVNGICYVDLEDIRQIIPNASSSCGSAELLAEMETTLKQFPTIKKSIFAISGDPATFYNWLQIGCNQANNFCDKKPFQ